MLEVRIKRRLKALASRLLQRVLRLSVFGRKGLKEEIVHLIDVVTTNKTDFFREPGHFDFLVEKALPELTARDAGGRPLLIWSAGCSTGEEPYTLAMVLSEYALTHPGFRFRILATDISTTVLEKAELGVYSSEVVRPVPPALKRKYFMRSRDRELADACAWCRSCAGWSSFGGLNFMDADYRHSRKGRRDLLPQRDHLLRPAHAGAHSAEACQHLVPGGYMFVGHAETLHDMDLPLAPVAPALYRRIDAEPEATIAGGVCAARRVAPGDGADDPAHRAWLLRRHCISGFRGWALARSAIPCCRVARPSSSRS